eukprot:2324424-Pyramimonas_sp.AAC.1
MVFASSPFRFRWPSKASRLLQEGPIRGSRVPQDGAKSAQERPKKGPRCDSGDSRGGVATKDPPFVDRSPPRCP